MFVRQAWCVILWCVLAIAPVFSAAAAERKPITLLVHGLTLSFKEPVQVWGTGALPLDPPGTKAEWSGMIGHLRAKGMKFGGIVQPRLGKVRLPEQLDAGFADGEPREADLFALYFSPAANVDGLGFKCAELAETLRRLREYTGAKKVRLVAHSAGGLVARAYLQELIPGIEYADDVERLITIATPHLGSDAAEHFGDFFGTRLTCLQPTNAAILELNRELPLPPRVQYASIVVRSLWNDTQGGGSAYDHLVSKDTLAACGVDFQQGGDQIISVRTQNLRLAPVALRYERETGNAIQQVVVRVPSESGKFAHVTATQSPAVQGWVERLLLGGDGCFTGKWGESERKEWITAAALAPIASAAEQETWNHWWMSGVQNIRPEVSELTGSAEQWKVRFQADADWQRLCRMGSGTHHVAGSVQLKVDPFGRIVFSQFELAK